jgi:hypothetical protein
MELIWEPIETAPQDGTIVWLKSTRWPLHSPELFHWTGQRWRGWRGVLFGPVEVYWDPDDLPTHWAKQSE